MSYRDANIEREQTEAESTGIVCTASGQPVCDPAFAGLDCQTPMPTDQYVIAPCISFYLFIFPPLLSLTWRVQVH